MINQINQKLRWLWFLEQFLIVVLLVLLPTQLGKHFWPDFSSIFSLRVDYFSPTIYLWDLILLVLFGLCCLRGVKLNMFGLSLSLIFLLSQLVSLLFSDNLEIGLIRLGQLTIATGFGLYLGSQSWGLLKKPLLIGLTGGILVQSIIVFGQFITGHTLGWWLLGERSFNLNTTGIATFNWYGQVFLRPYGTFPHPNVLAGVMLLMILGLGLVKWQKWWLVVIANSMILLTFSRTAILALLILWGFLWSRSNRWLLFLMIGVSPLLIVRFWSALNFDYLSWLRRSELLDASILIWKSSPWFGVGLNSFIVEMANSQLISGASRFLQPVHNVWWLLLSETGVVGLMGFVIMIGGVLVRLWKYRSLQLVQLVYWGWFVILWVGFWDHYWLTLVQGQRMLWCWWGWSLAIMVMKLNEDNIQSNKSN